MPELQVKELKDTCAGGMMIPVVLCAVSGTLFVDAFDQKDVLSTTLVFVFTC